MLKVYCVRVLCVKLVNRAVIAGPVILLKKTNPNVPNKLIILKDEDRRAAKQRKKHNMSSVRKLEIVFNFLNAVSG